MLQNLTIVQASLVSFYKMIIYLHVFQETKGIKDTYQQNNQNNNATMPNIQNVNLCKSISKNYVLEILLKMSCS